MEQKMNSGAIFKNDKKTSEKAPDYKGKIDVNGQEFALALWVRESKTGTKYFSVKVEEPYSKPPQDTPETTNDLPF